MSVNSIFIEMKSGEPVAGNFPDGNENAMKTRGRETVVAAPDGANAKNATKAARAGREFEI
jgi:hypothetical protein